MKAIRIASLGLAALVLAAQAQAAVITQWTFNSGGDANVTTGTTSPAVGAGAASLIGGTTATFATGTVTDASGAVDGNSGWNTATYPAISAGNKTAGTQYAVSTAGFQDIVVSFELRGSNTSSRYYRVQYSTNGTDFTDFGAEPFMLPIQDAFTLTTADLSSIAGVNDNANFAFRVVSEFEPGGTGYVATRTSVPTVYSSSGTYRLDLVSVSGTVIPEPATFGLLALAPLALARRRGR